MINIKSYKHIIWDWNGTLFNDVELCANLMNILLEEAKLPIISIEEYRNVFTFPVIEYYKALGHDVEPKNWERISHKFISDYEIQKYDYSIYSDAVMVLEKVKNFGISQSILSAYKQETLDELVSYSKIENYFIKLVGLDNIYAEGKIENGIKWMKELGFAKGEVLMIGDTLHDCEVAQAIGADLVLISSGHQALDKLKTCNVPIIDSLSELVG